MPRLHIADNSPQTSSARPPFLWIRCIEYLAFIRLSKLYHLPIIIKVISFKACNFPPRFKPFPPCQSSLDIRHTSRDTYRISLRPYRPSSAFGSNSTLFTPGASFSLTSALFERTRNKSDLHKVLVFDWFKGAASPGYSTTWPDVPTSLICG